MAAILAIGLLLVISVIVVFGVCSVVYDEDSENMMDIQAYLKEEE